MHISFHVQLTSGWLANGIAQEFFLINFPLGPYFPDYYVLILFSVMPGFKIISDYLWGLSVRALGH